VRISINSAVEIDYTQAGYGHAVNNMYKSLVSLGHTVSIKDPSAPVQLNWMQPHLFVPNRYQYQILYFPWESTELPEGWVEICNSDYVDEVWTTSEWCKQVYINAGITKDITVYQHGITHHWRPKKRIKDGPVKYLIVDAAANRKGYQEAFDAFRDVFKDDRLKAQLTIKSRDISYARYRDGNNVNHFAQKLPNVTANLKTINSEEMVQLYLDHDVLIYPSYGEGWGFIPQQALATGMLTICTKEWAPYKHYLGDLGLNSYYGHTPWEGEHPGDVCYPDLLHLRELIQRSYDDFDNQSNKFFKQSWAVHEEYNWYKLTEKAFEKVVKKFE